MEPFSDSGATAEEFISNGLDTLRGTLSSILGTDPENIEIFTVRNVPEMQEMIDVRYAAHGSPWYRESKVDGLAQEKSDTVSMCFYLEF